MLVELLEGLLSGVTEIMKKVKLDLRL